MTSPDKIPSSPNADPVEARVRDYFERLYRPGAAQFHGIVHVAANPVSGVIAFSGPMMCAGGGFPVTRIGLLAPDGAVTLLGSDTANDSQPKWSPDGARLAFLSDRDHGAGNFQLMIAPADAPEAATAPAPIAGEAIESFVWAPDSRHILLQSADAGADAAGSAATARIGGASSERPSWMPTVETGGHDGLWRHAHILDIESGALARVGADDQNVWEADWCGPDAVVAVISASPTEGGWYQTEIAIAPAAGGAFERFAAPEVEIAGVTASPDGKTIAAIEGRFHRTVQLGSLILYDRATGAAREPDIGAQVSALAWRDANRLFFAGFAAPGSVAGTLDIASNITTIAWRAPGTAGRKVPYAVPEGHDAVLVPGHAFDRYPYLARSNAVGEQMLLDLTPPDLAPIQARMKPAEVVRWQGRDGLDILGYLAMPVGIERPPLVAFIHGGPSHLFRDSWSFDNPLAALLVSSGYAVLFPNPRGSSGRGLDFASRVIGDMAGEDANDILAGIDHVIANHPVDGSRLFVTGGSYGGFMTTWLVGQTGRFQAACAIAPLTDMRSQYFTAHHPEFLSLYSRGDPYDVGGTFDQRSPLAHANKVTTPTLLIAGEIDKTTPPAQAVQFHHALVLGDVPTELVLYPEEGHAALRYEAQIDQGTRVLHWFARWEGRN
ncbi:S9 family peptidase [Sphingopyxis sp. R3-92]|uniref:S9 family peptidase n=1 Tax=Sphingopyxis sp. R3-92 TaxID=3158553 RepID=UPI003EE7E1CF